MNCLHQHFRYRDCNSAIQHSNPHPCYHIMYTYLCFVRSLEPLQTIFIKSST